MIRPSEPEIVRWVSGFAATTPRDHPYRIGVVGSDENEARRRFTAAFAAWDELSHRSKNEAATTPR